MASFVIKVVLGFYGLLMTFMINLHGNYYSIVQVSATSHTRFTLHCTQLYVHACGIIVSTHSYSLHGCTHARTREGVWICMYTGVFLNLWLHGTVQVYYKYVPHGIYVSEEGRHT